MIKLFFKKIYRWFPFKKLLATLVKESGFLSLLSNHTRSLVANYLVFEGKIKINTESGPSFYMELGYGRQIEALIYYFGINAFEGSTISLWVELSKKSNVIIDIGANTGIYSMLAASKNPKSKIYSFEPINRVFEILEKNIHLNSYYPQISASKIALSDYNGIGDMYDLPVEHMYTASLNENIHKDRGQKIPAIIEKVAVVTFDEFKKNEGISKIDLIKIDVESHEPSVLMGMSDTLKNDLPTLIIEIWNNEIGGRVEEIIKIYPYTYYVIHSNSIEKVSEIKNDDPEKGYLNYLVCTSEVAKSLEL
jgi:FkbM family methyltransferase